MPLKRVVELPWYKRCIFHLLEEERNGVDVLEEIGDKNYLNTTWMQLGSKAGEIDDRPGACLTISTPEPDLKKLSS